MATSILYNSARGTRYELDKEIRTRDYWVDGKPIYAKVITKSNIKLDKNTKIPHGITNLENLIDLKIYVNDGTQNNYVVLPYFNSNNNYSINGLLDQNNILFSGNDVWGAYSNRKVYAIIFYTKAGGSISKLPFFQRLRNTFAVEECYGN